MIAAYFWDADQQAATDDHIVRLPINLGHAVLGQQPRPRFFTLADNFHAVNFDLERPFIEGIVH